MKGPFVVPGGHGTFMTDGAVMTDGTFTTDATFMTDGAAGSARRA